MIQIITYTGNNERYKGTLVEQYSFHDIRSLDEYDINIIDLSDSGMWRNVNSNKTLVDCIDDLKSISTMITNSQKAKIIILFPQNIKYHYCYAYHKCNDFKSYGYVEELKNMLNEVTKYILSKLYQPISSVELVYENTKSKIGSKEYAASFYFGNDSSVLLKSVRSDKATVIKRNKVVLSTLEIKNYSDLISFLQEIHLLDEKQSVPEWMSQIKMFDDNVLENIISENENQIQLAKDNIDKANQVLESNDRLKSVLYTSGTELVTVVFEILEEMLGCDLSSFIDEMEADFIFEINNLVFVGEIKGVNHNVKNENVSQLDVHYQGYLDKYEDINPDNVVALLIMNHQKNKSITEREQIKDTQINLAKRNGSLIIETYTLLKLLENYRNKSISREQIIQLLADSKGCLCLEGI